jgi:hypothetical protein
MGKELLDYLVRSYLDLEFIPWHSLEERGHAEGSDSFPCGKLLRDAMEVNYYTGPAIDPTTAADNDYVALDYQLPLLFKRHRMRQMVDDIDYELVTQGMEQIQILDPPR